MERYPKRVNARKKVYEAIQSGRLVRNHVQYVVHLMHKHTMKIIINR